MMDDPFLKSSRKPKGTDTYGASSQVHEARLLLNSSFPRVLES